MLCLLIAHAMLISAGFGSVIVPPAPPLPMQCTLVVMTDDAPSVEPGDPLTTEDIA